MSEHISSAVFRESLKHKTALIICMLIIAMIYFILHGIRQEIKVPITNIKHENGFSYWIDLTGPQYTALTNQADNIHLPERSSLSVLENGIPIGSRHSLHNDIRNKGKGYYSHWNKGVYFSTSDNTDPRINNRHYTLAYQKYPDRMLIYIVAGIVLISLIPYRSVLSASFRWLITNDITLVVMISVASLFITLAILESGFRYFTPFKSIEWPIIFDPEVGFYFKPNSVIKHTNHLDFWTVDRSNSWGFLDKEPPATPPTGCHFSFIGDSFIEAAQVQQSEKVQRLVENWANTKHPEWKLTTSAFGYSGTGQLNQLPFYDKFAKRLKPDLVILVFVSNDFANNSNILEALRNGWHPDSAPRTFAKKLENMNYTLSPIDSDWQSKKLAPLATDIKNNRLHKWLKDTSYLYRWTWLKLSLLYPKIKRLEGPTNADQVLNRVHQLEIEPLLAQRLTGWKDHYALDIDRPFHNPYLTQVYQDAIDMTKFALQEFKKRTDADGAQLLILAASQLRTSTKPEDKLHYAFQRLKNITDELDIPLIDQYDFILRQSGDLLDAQFRHDQHWTMQGHRWAADAIQQWLENNNINCPRKNNHYKIQ